MVEAKFANDPLAKFVFYNIIGQRTKAGCLNLIDNFFNRNLSNKYLLHLGEHGEQSQDHSFVWYLLGLITAGGYKITKFTAFVMVGGKRDQCKVLNVPYQTSANKRRVAI